MAAIAVGLCQISKYSGIFIYPILFLLVLSRHSKQIMMRLRQGKYQALWQSTRTFIFYSLLFLGVSILIINVGFLFNRTGIPFDEFKFRSQLFQSIQSRLSVLNGIPIPLPLPYLEGLDWVLFNERSSATYGSIYLLDQLKHGSGFPGYFFIATIFKMPLPILALVALSIANLVKRMRKGRFPREQGYLWIPILFFAIYFNFFFRAQIGIRFFLIVFPLLIITSVHLFKRWDHLPSGGRLASILAGVYLIISVGSYFPHYLSYFNELVFKRLDAYRILSDSNIDWGQNRENVELFIEQNPEVIFEPDEPASGTLLVGVNQLTGVLEGPDAYRWLRENFKPVDQLFYTHLFFEISPAELGEVISPSP